MRTYCSTRRRGCRSAQGSFATGAGNQQIRPCQNRLYVLTYIDGLIVLRFSLIGALVLMLLLRDPPRILSSQAARK